MALRPVPALGNTRHKSDGIPAHTVKCTCEKCSCKATSANLRLSGNALADSLLLSGQLYLEFPVAEAPVVGPKLEEFSMSTNLSLPDVRMTQWCACAKAIRMT